MEEILLLSAEDGIFYGHTFFPRTFRQNSPEFHYEMFDELENPDNRFVAFEVFRDGAKTTILRTFTSKRIAFALSNTIVFMSDAQRHAERSIRWMRNQIDNNRRWADTFGLKRGSKWTDSEIEIINERFETRINMLAIGMTGQTRGINVDDFRPDLIVVDDPNNEENTNTVEGRQKTDELFFGAIQNTLAPASENPRALMALAQTSLHPQDLINKCHKDPTWKTVKYSIFDEEGKSRWPQRYPTEDVQRAKAGFIGRGQLHIWLREKECRIVSAEGNAFNSEDIRFYDNAPAFEAGPVYIGIDPAREKHKNPLKAHKAAIVQIQVTPQGVFLLRTFAQKQKNPEELWAEFYRMATLAYPRLTGVETIAYQQMLAWYFRQKMQQLNTYFVIREVEDRRNKANRIRQALSGLLAAHRLFVHPSMTDVVEAITDYSDEKDIDILDALAIAITLSNPHLIEQSNQNVNDEEDFTILIGNESQYPDLPALGGCP